MDDSALLSFRSPRSEPDRVTARPSPTLELGYAHFYLGKASATPGARSERLAWERKLREDAPELARHLVDEWPDDVPRELLLVGVCWLGYVEDDDVDRVLADLPSFPARIAGLLEGEREATGESEKDAHLDAMLSGARRFESEVETYAPHVAALWERLRPGWEREGREEVERACARFHERYAETGDVLQALPRHHFTRFEKGAAHLRASLERRDALVVPLYHASSGGLAYELPKHHIIGFGLQSEAVFEATSSRVHEVAHTARAFADPTRLMILTLIARYGRFSLTVGDLAEQLDVSQPTVSGHLKLLRDLGLVDLTKRGTKSYYHVVEPVLREALDEIDALLLS